MPAKYSPEERAAVYWSRVDKNGPIPPHRPDLGPCWLWTGPLHHTGYANVGFHEGGRRIQEGAHVWAYRTHVGPVPRGKELDHLCRVRHCLRPSHLEPVTKRENWARGESPSAIVRRTQACMAGHPFDDKNTYRSAKGSRNCRACNKAARARYVAKRMAS